MFDQVEFSIKNRGASSDDGRRSFIEMICTPMSEVDQR